jgi:hypothetical protein
MDHPQDEISNRELHVKLYLPDTHQGYYRGTRFDWSGVISGLTYQGHDYYGPWYTKTDPAVHDFVYAGPDIIAGPCSAISGPVEEFAAVGYDQVPPGGTFLKIGIGRLRKPDASPYDQYRLYEIGDPGTWTVHKGADRVEFIQQVEGAYVYRKVVRLAAGRPRMVIEHSLRNTGRVALHTEVYNHNFLVLDGKPPGPGLTISFPFEIKSPGPIGSGLARIEGKRIVYLKTLEQKDTMEAPIQGAGPSAADYAIRIESREAGMGMRITGDRPLAKASLWSIRSVVAVEPFIAIAIGPGEEFTWNLTYDYFPLAQ